MRASKEEVLAGPKCHPDKPYGSKGLCENCYKLQWRHAKRPPRWHRNPIKSYVVYLYMARDGTIVYVGRGKIDRALAHKYPYKSSWWSEDLMLLTMTCDDEWQAMEYEGKWGGRYHPTENVEGNREFWDPGTRSKDRRRMSANGSSESI